MVPSPEHCQIPASASRCMKPQRGLRSTEANSAGSGTPSPLPSVQMKLSASSGQRLPASGRRWSRRRHTRTERRHNPRRTCRSPAARALAAAIEEELAIDPPHAVDEAMGGAVAFRDAVVSRIFEAIDREPRQRLPRGRRAAPIHREDVLFGVDDGLVGRVGAGRVEPVPQAVDVPEALTRRGIGFDRDVVPRAEDAGDVEITGRVEAQAANPVETSSAHIVPASPEKMPPSAPNVSTFFGWPETS